MAKRQTKNKVPSKRWEKYGTSGETLERKGKFCPKCGDGFFMAQHKGRTTCGKCGYTEFQTSQ